MNTKIMRAAKVTAVLAASVLVLYGCGGGKKSNNNAPTVTTTAREIASAYNANTVAADQQFKNKRFKVSGKVENINTDITGSPYITMNGGVNPFMQPQFGFDKNHINDVAKIKKGQKITLICTGKGDIAKTPMSDDCEIAK